MASRFNIFDDRSTLRPAMTPERQEALAQAGLDLFLGGFVQDTTRPQQAPVESSHYLASLASNLKDIPEEEIISSYDDVHSDSQLIVIIGGPVEDDHTPGVLLSQRVTTGLALYAQIVRQLANINGARCFFVPTGGDVGDIGCMQAEVIRNELTAHNIPPHNIVMDCIYNNTIDNAVKLIPVLRHLHITTVHIITSAFHIPRMKHVFDGIMGAVEDTKFTLQYHMVPDGLTRSERVVMEKHEQRQLIASEDHLQDCVQKVLRGEWYMAHTTSQV